MKMSMQSSSASSLRALLNVGLRFRQECQRRVRHLGMTRSQIAALACLSMQPGLAQTDLAEEIEAHPVTVTYIVDRLQRNGWIKRQVNEDDRRQFQVFVTDKADAVLAELWQAAASLGDSALDGFTASERRQLDDFLGRIERNIAGLQAAGGRRGPRAA